MEKKKQKNENDQVMSEPKQDTRPLKFFKVSNYRPSIVKDTNALLPGDRVKKTSGDYQFRGRVMAAFTKLDRLTIRYIVENKDGVVHVFSRGQLERVGK